MGCTHWLTVEVENKLLERRTFSKTTFAAERPGSAEKAQAS
jgi:hypothetical protein